MHRALGDEHAAGRVFNDRGYDRDGIVHHEDTKNTKAGNDSKFFFVNFAPLW